jgi:hypothetical protein
MSGTALHAGSPLAVHVLQAHKLVKSQLHVVQHNMATVARKSHSEMTNASNRCSTGNHCLEYTNIPRVPGSLRFFFLRDFSNPSPHTTAESTNITGKIQ